ncbi:hypothetical protein P4050_16510 [Pseudomonas aeruginosa]|nr:hypothetical protein [Pseudomonas aeruginosa]
MIWLLQPGDLGHAGICLAIVGVTPGSLISYQLRLDDPTSAGSWLKLCGLPLLACWAVAGPAQALEPVSNCSAWRRLEIPPILAGTSPAAADRHVLQAELLTSDDLAEEVLKERHGTPPCHADDPAGAAHR